MKAGSFVLKVNPSDLNEAAQLFSLKGTEIDNCTSKMLSLVEDLSSVWDGNTSLRYRTSFSKLNDDVIKITAMVREHADDLVDIASNYETYELTNSESSSELKIAILSGAAAGAGLTLESTSIPMPCINAQDSTANADAADSNGKMTYSAESDKALYEKKKNNKTLFDTNDKVEGFDRDGSFFSASYEKKHEASVFKFEGEGTSEYANGSYSVKGPSAEAHYGLSGGLYDYIKEPKGKSIRDTGLGFGATAGAGATLFTVSGDGRLGFGENNSMLGLNGSGEVSIGKVDAGVDLTIDLISNNPQAYVSLNAEAIAGEAKGSAGVTVLGTDIDVTGGVSFGAGAHLDAGFKEGVFKFEAGAAIGLGVDVGFEIDASQTINYIIDNSEYFGDFADGLIDEAGEWMSGAGEYITQTVSEAWSFLFGN